MHKWESWMEEDEVLCGAQTGYRTHLSSLYWAEVTCPRCNAMGGRKTLCVNCGKWSVGLCDECFPISDPQPPEEV